MSLSSLNLIRQTIFELESGNGNFEGETYKKWTNKQTELHQFQRKPSYDGDLSPCQVWTIFELASGNRNFDGQTNGQKADKPTDTITSISKGT